MFRYQIVAMICSAYVLGACGDSFTESTAPFEDGGTDAPEMQGDGSVIRENDGGLVTMPDAGSAMNDAGVSDASAMPDSAPLTLGGPCICDDAGNCGCADPNYACGKQDLDNAKQIQGWCGLYCWPVDSGIIEAGTGNFDCKGISYGGYPNLWYCDNQSNLIEYSKYTNCRGLNTAGGPTLFCCKQ